MNKVKWGIISTGTIAHAFAQDFKFVPNGALMAVASRNIETAQEFAAEYDIPKSYATYEELYADPDIDAVYIATPHNFHFQNSMDAINAGKSVMCEKPLTVSPDEAVHLTQHARKKKVYLMEALWTYFLPSIQKAQEWIAEGRIGEVRQIRADFGYPVDYDPLSRMFNPDLAGGSLLDMGIYPVSMAWLFLKKDPIQIKAIERKAPTGVDYDMHMTFDYGEEVAILNSSFRSKLFNHLFVIGTEGYVQVPDFWRASECMLFKSEEQIDHFMENRESLGYCFETIAMNEDLLNGKLESEIMPHAYSLKIQEIIKSVKDAARR
ncbi:MAG: Gfo/Idh/MocA family oxidoreductase [Cyclobacteriaceae bacterium]